MEILISIFKKIAEYSVQPIGCQLGYIYYYNNNIEDLDEHVKMLKDTRESVQHLVSGARRNAEDIIPDVQNWLSKVDAIIEQSKTILDNEDQANSKCLGGLCLNLIPRYQLGKDAKKIVVEVLKLKTQVNFERVSYNQALSEVTSSSKILHFLSFESRKSTVEQIMDALMDDNVNSIGVYGMGGIGKTMLVKEISRKVRADKSFDVVVMSTVSQTPDLKGIQGQLGDILGLKFEQETVEGRAIKLYMRLKIEKNILVVFDDIWDYIDLERIGIPSVADHKGCKILFTSRERHTLSNEMCTDKIFEVKVLQQDESWNLFKQMAGEIVEASHLKPIALQVVAECAHLPIAVTTVAKALRNKPLSIWKDALNQLRNPVAVNIRGMNEKVYNSLKLSYEQLECEEAKILFLICSMFPEDFHINVEGLHVYAMGMRLLLGIDTLAEGRHRIIKLVDDLVSSSLLLGMEHDDGYVKMHDLIRDVAISIASGDNQIHTLCYVQGLNEWKEEKVSGNYTVVYLKFGDLHNPPQKLMLPKVQLLKLVGPYFNGYTELSGIFFEEMKELKVLETTYMKISPSPPSLQSFTNLRSLRLIDCELESIDFIGELKKLEILSFERSDITEIPVVVSQLTELKVLDLYSCHKLKVISPNILSRLTKLEELDLAFFNGWEEDSLNRERRNASLCELKHLPRLYSLSFHIQDEQILPKQLFSRELNLEKFDIYIGKCSRIVDSPTINRTLYLNMESESPLDDWIKILIKKSNELLLGGSTGEKVFRFELNEIVCSDLKHLGLENMSKVKHFIYDSKKTFWKIFTNLKSIEIRDCEMMEVFIRMESEEATNQIKLTHLNSLELNHLPRLTSFCHKVDHSENDAKTKISDEGSFFNNQVSLPNLEYLGIMNANKLKMMICNNVLIPDSSFAKLKSVAIVSCNNLEKVFSSNMIHILNCLQFLTIKDCNLLEGVFEVEEPHTTKQCDGLLSRLSSLNLHNLPNLKYVWSKDPEELQIFENLHDFYIQQCPKLKRVYPVKILPQLTSLEIEYDELVETLEQAKLLNESSKVETVELWDGAELLPKLKILNLSGSLKFYKRTCLPMEIVGILHNLTELEIREIFVEEIFPNCPNATSYQLNWLRLSKLPKLKHLWKESSQMNNLMLLNLRDLTIKECGRLDYLVPSSLSSLRNLRILKIHKCDGLTHLLNPQLASTLVRLEHIKLKECKMMSTVIAQGLGDDDDQEIVFTTLKSLKLGDLPTLTSFHSGKCSFRFPCLGSVTIMNCPEMKVFSMGVASTPRLKKDSVWWSDLEIPKDSKESMVEDINVIARQAFENISDYGIQHLLTQQGLLPDLENLKFEYAHSWKMICPRQFLPGSLAKLKRLEIAFCNNLEKIFPSNVMSILECLTHIKIESCRLLQGIFEVEESDVTKEECVVMLPQLSSLKLLDLPNLKHIWSKDPQELQIFENMKQLSIYQCPKFKRVYPLKVLHELESFEIEYGELMETLEKVKSINMEELGQFDSASKDDEIVELWDGPYQLLPKLKTLWLSGSLKCECAHLSKEVVPILHNLEELKLRETFFEEVFQSETERLINHVEEDENVRTYPLQRLVISKLHKLRGLWKESSHMNTSLLQNLKYLRIEECGGLNILVPSSVSFGNLRSLTIYKCNKMTYVLNSSVARTLVQLEFLTLRECKRMTTIIEEGSEVEEEIVFTKLGRLELYDLPILTSFNSGRCIIRFPNSLIVNIRNCPEMKIFSPAIGITHRMLRAEWYSSVSQKYSISKKMEIEDINFFVRQAWENDYDSSSEHLFTKQTKRRKRQKENSKRQTELKESSISR